ncbi:MAG: hypothetical protein KDA93_03900 [Planctomycetaceae bacterium]|nr:hypothetical protein [Planctomycetaceae bacterium]
MTHASPHRRLEADREDLMREATALRQRAEFRAPGQVDSVIAGYRSDGSLSIYFGPDPCLHFNSALQLRRAYVDGYLYRTQGTTLARLHRDRSGKQVELRRHDLSPTELERFLDQVRAQLTTFFDALQEANAECLQSVPPNADITSRLTKDLSDLVSQPLQLAPAIAGKR